MTRKITAVVQFHAYVPSTEYAADKHADDLSDAIAGAVERLTGFGITEGSVSVIDWTDEEPS